MLRNYIKTAWRSILRNRSYTTISLCSLILGVTLFFFIAIWVKDEVAYDKQFQAADRVFRVESNLRTSDGSDDLTPAVGWPVGKHLASGYPDIEYLSYVRGWNPYVNIKDERFYERALYADNNFFKIFSYQWLEGNAATALELPYSVVITESLKKKFFGDAVSVLGKTLMVYDTIPYSITGVVKDETHAHIQFGMLGSFDTYCAINKEDCEEEFTKGWFDLNVYNYIKLRDNVSPAAVEAKIKDLVSVDGKDAVAASGFDAKLQLRPLKDIYLRSGLPTGSTPTGNWNTVKLFLAIGIFILLIACLNFINLATARSVERAREIGIRKVMGSSRFKLIRQFLSEAGLLCVIAAIISVVLLWALLPWFNAFTGKQFTQGDLFSAGNIALMLVIILVLIPLAGFYPAWVLSAFKPIKVLKGRFAHTTSGASLRKGLIIAQFTISVGFIISTIVVWKQMSFMQSQALGFNKNNVLLVDANKVPWTLKHDKAGVFKNELLAARGITSVTACNAVPGRTGWNGQFAYPEGMPKEQGISVEYIPVDADYMRTMDLKLVTGRDFMAGSKADEEESFLINEAAVKIFGWSNAANAIGKHLETSGKKGTVIGVLKNYHQHGLQQNIKPVVLGIGSYIGLFALRYNGIDPQQAIDKVKAAWNNVYKGYPLEYRFMEDDFLRQYRKEEKLQLMFRLAAALSVVIACMGLLGLAVYTAQKRVKEIGIRKIMGAGTARIVMLLSKDFLLLVGIAIVVACPLTWWVMSQWLQQFAYRTGLSWWIFVLAGVLALLIAMITICVQSVKAAIANPVDALRNE
ncbi:MAG: ABC transporter permease [Chitinophagaceae bacterium]